MIPPSIVIRVEFERAKPIVSSDALNEGEQNRLVLWLREHPALAELVDRALELERAA